MPKIPITKVMCEIMDFNIKERVHETSNYDWIAYKGMIKIHSLDGEVKVSLVSGGIITILDHIKYVHEIQQLYKLLHNEKI